MVKYDQKYYFIKSSCVWFAFTLSHFRPIGFEKIAQILIENGANVNAVDQQIDSALIVAATFGNIIKSDSHNFS